MAGVDVGFAVNDIVSFKDGTSGKIIEITKPLGTYCIYHVKSMFDGSVNEYAKHQLVKLESSQDCQERENHDDFETDIESDQYLMQLLIDEKEFREMNSTEVSIEPNNPPPPPIHKSAIPTAQPKPTRNQFLEINDSDVDAFNKEKRKQKHITENTRSCSFSAKRI